MMLQKEGHTRVGTTFKYACVRNEGCLCTKCALEKGDTQINVLHTYVCVRLCYFCVIFHRVKKKKLPYITSLPTTASSFVASKKMRRELYIKHEIQIGFVHGTMGFPLPLSLTL